MTKRNCVKLTEKVKVKTVKVKAVAPLCVCTIYALFW